MIAHKGYWDDVPPLGRAGRRWLRRRLYAVIQRWLKAQTRIDPEDPDNDPLISAIVAELVDTSATLLSWENQDRYTGWGSGGAYILLVGEVQARLPEVFAAVARRLDHEDFPELEKWLSALARGILYAPAPSEPAHAEVLKRTGQHICSDCRRPFVLDRKNAVRCPSCRRQRRETGGARPTRRPHDDHAV